MEAIATLSLEWAQDRNGLMLGEDPFLMSGPDDVLDLSMFLPPVANANAKFAAIIEDGNIPFQLDDEISRKSVEKQGVSEYFLFTIEGREDLEDGLSKRLPSFQAEGVPFDLTYVHDPRRFGPGLVKLYKLANEAPEEQPDSPLGQSPLPGGFYQVFRETANGGLAYLGRHDGRYIPIGEDLEISLGQDGLIAFDNIGRRYKRLNISYSSDGDVNGWNDAHDGEFALRNSKREAVPVEIRRSFQGDFDFEPADPGLWEKISETERELKAQVPPMSEARFGYALRIRQGANARK